jgi:hypothetical protein
MTETGFRTTIVFGPEASETAEQYRAAGLDGVIDGGRHAERLELPDFARERVRLAFAHRVPERWSAESKQQQRWLLALTSDLGLGRYEMGFPDTRGLNTYESDAAVLLFSWDATDTATVLRVAHAIDRSYAGLGGR